MLAIANSNFVSIATDSIVIVIEIKQYELMLIIFMLI